MTKYVFKILLASKLLIWWPVENVVPQRTLAKQTQRMRFWRSISLGTLQSKAKQVKVNPCKELVFDHHWVKVFSLLCGHETIFSQFFLDWWESGAILLWYLSSVLLGCRLAGCLLSVGDVHTKLCCTQIVATGLSPSLFDGTGLLPPVHGVVNCRLAAVCLTRNVSYWLPLIHVDWLW